MRIKIQLLYKVDGLHALVKKYFKTANEKENALLMEFVLHGLAAYSLISKKVLEGKIEFKDLMGSMLNMGSQPYSEEDFNERISIEIRKQLTAKTLRRKEFL